MDPVYLVLENMSHADARINFSINFSSSDIFRIFGLTRLKFNFFDIFHLILSFVAFFHIYFNVLSSVQSQKKETVFTVALIFFYKQLVYKQLALRWQIAKQLSGLKPLSLSSNKNYRVKEKWSYSFVINVKKLLNQQFTKIQLSQKHYWENVKSLMINIDFVS